MNLVMKNSPRLAPLPFAAALLGAFAVAPATAQTPQTPVTAAPDTYIGVPKRALPPALTTPEEGRRVAALALSYVGAGKYKEGGTNLIGGVDNDRFVSQVFKQAGVGVPDPPAVQMALYGKIVHWRPGAVTLDGKIVTFPECPAKADALQPGDRLFFEREGAMLTGIYVGPYKGATHEYANAFVWCDPAAGRVVLREWNDGETESEYRFAARGWTRRYVGPPPGEISAVVTGIKPKPAVAPMEGRVLALCVGVARYPGAEVAAIAAGEKSAAAFDDLKRQVQDADSQTGELFLALKKAYGGRFRLLSDSRRTLSESLTGSENRAPNAATIESAFANLASSAQDGDTLIFSFAGLGKGEYIYPSDITPGGDARRALPLERLLSQAALSRIARIILLLDYSNAAPPRAALEAFRATGKEAVVLCASNPNTEAHPEAGSGLFIPALTEAFAEKSGADKNGDGILTADEILAFVRARYDAEAATKQTVTLFAIPNGGVAMKRPLPVQTANAASESKDEKTQSGAEGGAK